MEEWYFKSFMKELDDLLYAYGLETKETVTKRVDEGIKEIYLKMKVNEK